MYAFECKQAEIDVIFATFAAALNLPGHAITYANAIARPLWDAFPLCTRWHNPAVFAEVLAFHALKAAGLPLDEAAFRKASALGEMAMTKRHWLLHYSRYVPPALRVASRDPGIEPFLAKVGDAGIVAVARAIASQHEGVLARLKPSMRAGVCILLAIKTIKNDHGPASGILSRAGIRLASAINAAKRLGLYNNVATIRSNEGHYTMATV